MAAKLAKFYKKNSPSANTRKSEDFRYLYIRVYVGKNQRRDQEGGTTHSDLKLLAHDARQQIFVVGGCL